MDLSLVRESIINEVDADTPSFNFDEIQNSFQSSLVSEQSNMKRSKNFNQMTGSVAS